MIRMYKRNEKQKKAKQSSTRSPGAANLASFKQNNVGLHPQNARDLCFNLLDYSTDCFAW